MVKKKSLITLFFILTTAINYGYGQKIPAFYQLYREGNSYKEAGNFSKAQSVYLQALSINPKSDYLYVDLISTTLHLKKDKEAEAYLKAGVLRGTSIEQLQNDSLIKNKFNLDSSWRNTYDVYRQKYNSSIPYQEEKLKLMVLIQKDQDVRRLMYFFKENQRDSIIHAQDIETSEEVYKILKKIGFPDADKVGNDAAGVMFIMLHHLLNDGVNDEKELEYFEPMLREAVLKGAFEPFWMGILIDRSRVIRGLNQTYGCYWQNDKGKRIITPIDDIKDVDKRRWEIGLGPLKDSAKQGLILPENYKSN